MTEKTDRKNINLVYTGTFYDSNKNKLYYGICILKNDNTLGEIQYFSTKPKYVSPGSIITADVATEGLTEKKFETWYPSTAKTQGFLTQLNPDLKDRVTAWQVATTAHREARTKLKEGNVDLIEPHIDALRFEYNKLSAHQKKAFLAYVIYNLTK